MAGDLVIEPSTETNGAAVVDGIAGTVSAGGEGRIVTPSSLADAVASHNANFASALPDNSGGDISAFATVMPASTDDVTNGEAKKKKAGKKKKKNTSLLLSDSDTDELWSSQHVTHAHPIVPGGTVPDFNPKPNGSSNGYGSEFVSDTPGSLKAGSLALHAGNANGLDVSRIAHYPENGGGEEGTTSSDSTGKKNKKKKKLYNYEAELERLQVRGAWDFSHCYVGGNHEINSMQYDST